MRKRTLLLALPVFLLALGMCPVGRAWAEPTPSPSPKKPEKKAGDKASPAPLNKFMGEGSTNGPTTTEIFADEAFFDSNKSMGIFSGHVKVLDPRFNLQSDKLTVFISKGENQGLERAIAEGNVVLV